MTLFRVQTHRGGWYLIDAEFLLQAGTFMRPFHGANMKKVQLSHGKTPIATCIPFYVKAVHGPV